MDPKNLDYSSVLCTLFCFALIGQCRARRTRYVILCTWRGSLAECFILSGEQWLLKTGSFESACSICIETSPGHHTSPIDMVITAFYFFKIWPLIPFNCMNLTAASHTIWFGLAGCSGDWLSSTSFAARYPWCGGSWEFTMISLIKMKITKLNHYLQRTACSLLFKGFHYFTILNTLCHKIFNYTPWEVFLKSQEFFWKFVNISKIYHKLKMAINRVQRIWWSLHAKQNSANGCVIQQILCYW